VEVRSHHDECCGIRRRYCLNFGQSARTCSQSLVFDESSSTAEATGGREDIVRQLALDGADAPAVVALAGRRRGVVDMLCVMWLQNSGSGHACMCYGVVDDANINIRGCGVQGHACLGG
jgi:hypothetical protein